MAYRFNNGRGGVTCDKCQVLIDENLSFDQYKQWHGQNGEPDLCMKCKNDRKQEKDDLLNDGWRN